jgi:hypothetical protein
MIFGHGIREVVFRPVGEKKIPVTGGYRSVIMTTRSETRPRGRPSRSTIFFPRIWLKNKKT